MASIYDLDWLVGYLFIKTIKNYKETKVFNLVVNTAFEWEKPGSLYL